MPNRVKFGTESQNATGEADVLAVPLNLCEESIGQLAANACLEAEADRTIIALPTIPQEGLTNGMRAAFRILVDAADTTVPSDTDRITDAFSHSKSRLPGAHREVESVLTAEWISDVFAAFRSLIAGRPAQRQPLFRILNSGGVSMLYWGWGTRQEEWDELISHAASHRVSDGKRRTADGGFGFVRFGGMFTRKDFDDLRTATADRLRHDEMKDDRWTVGGDTSRGLGSECRLAVLLTGLEVDTLPYI